MNTLKNRRRALLPLLVLAGLPLSVLMHKDRSVSAQTPAPAPTPVKSWSLVSALVKNTIGAIKHDLEELAEEFPPLGAFAREAKTDEDSLSYMKNGVRVVVEFRHPLARAEADAPGASWRVYRLKDGKLLGARLHVSAAVYGRGSPFERRVTAVVRAAEAQLLDHAGADTRGSTRDLRAVPFEGSLEEGGRYRAEISYDRARSEWVTAAALRLPHHHFGRIEWLNVGRFPGLYFNRPPDGRVEVVFEVVGKQVLRRSERTWTTEYRCLIIGVEGREPPRAEFLTLVAACKAVRQTGKRNLSVSFTFDVRRVVTGRFAAREFTTELAGPAAGAMLGALGVADPWGGRVACDTGREFELTFESPADGQTPERPGLLREFRVIE